MYEVIYLGDSSVTLHSLLMCVFAAGSIALGTLLASRKGLKPMHACLCGLLSAVLGLLIGRAIYSAVCWYEVFLDEMGEFMGPLAFFNPSTGSVNVMGIVAGVLLAAPVTAALTKPKAADYLDAAVVPALVMYVLARAIEPLSGQGYGDFMGYEVSVCWLEAALTVLLLALVPFLRKLSRRPGTLAQYALTLWCLLQLLPESLRCDEALYVFVFARVTHLGLAVTLGVTLIRLLVQGGRNGLDAKSIVIDSLAFAAGIGVCIATIFALDKTNLPKLLVYAVMTLSIVGLGFVICRRIHQEDVRKC